jgi:AraC-like DNA-binding protein
VKAVLEQIVSPEGSSFAVFNFASPRFQCPYHYHPEWELTLIQSGHGQRLVGDHLEPFAPGDLVLLGGNLPHTYFHSPDFDEGPRGARSLVIQFHPDLGGHFFKQAPECAGIRRLAQRCARGLVPGRKTSGQVIPLMHSLVPAPPLRRLALLLEILDLLAADTRARPLASPGFHPEFNKHQAGRLERACEWITLHFREPITLRQAARQAHLTPEAFSRFFRRATNRTYVHFLNELRIGHACRLLLESEESVASIAFASGFENLSNFNRRFLEFKGLTPRSFRSQARKNP